MTKWQRFGDGTWVNVDHVEVIRVEEQGDGNWQLTAAFASGRTHPLGDHADRDLLIDCTDVLLRGEVGEHLLALAGSSEETPSARAVAPDPDVVKRRRWWGGRVTRQAPVNATDGHPEAAHPQPAG